jgi:two-component system cell cycle sensor histidine kinase/response regulator CckA
MASVPSRLSPSLPAPQAGGRLRHAAVGAAGLGSLLLVWLAVRDLVVLIAAAALLLAVLAVALLLRRSDNAQASWSGSDDVAHNDHALLNALIDNGNEAIALTDRSGRLVTANTRFEDIFGGLVTPPSFGLGTRAEARLTDAARSAWRDGDAVLDDIEVATARLALQLTRIGASEQFLLWRFRPEGETHALLEARRFIDGDGGSRLGHAGVMTALVDENGILISANGAMMKRSGIMLGQQFEDVLTHGSDSQLRLVAEGERALPLRLVAIPLAAESGADGPAVILMLDEEAHARAHRDEQAAAPVHVQGLLAMLPLGLSLVDRDGRFLFMNDAFRRVASVGPDESPVYPGDLVVKEDKAPVSEAIRRFAAGRAMAGDIAIRLAQRPDEPIALTIATARGLGDAAVLLSLKDNSEESRLKRQVAQATKMQAVGQLAGGVAHDFNNILTAIIGHCDLMMMRHTPGDSDYDDIQQIKHNSNRAASLTRQLLAFSRQQTLRPQILQLPDVISEISNLLKRLLGETVKLEIKHGRNLGAVRADPGQLEQVIVNLAVNARDAMPGGGVLTLQTYGVTAAEARRIDSEVLPAADYTALSASDTGCGIPRDVLGKIFEPFFTTKEVGKGTGLGLSTVYGIVKQTGGFIFADSEVDKGTTFTIYLPVHHAEREIEAPAAPVKAKAPELWGTGTILLVEDEAMVRAVAERALIRQGYQVITATNGEEALEMLEASEKNEQKIDLLISDVVMPMMDGPTLVGHARERFPELPILFMSGYAEEQLRNSISIEHVSFLPKPFSVQQLCEAARDTLMNRID